MKVLLTDGSHKNTLSIIRYLGKIHEIYILHHKKSAPAYSRFCKKLIICPPLFQENDYYQFVIELVKREKFDVLIPVGIKPVEIFSKHLHEIRQYVKIEILEFEKIKVALYKNETFKLAEQIDIPCPKTVQPSSLEEATSFSRKLTYPLIIKSSNESVLKFPTIYVDDERALIEQFQHLEVSYPKQISLSYPLIQEKITGDGYGFFAIYQHGLCKKIFMHKRIRELPVSGGASTCAISIYDEKLKEISLKLLNHLKWHGQVMIEYKKDSKDGQFKLIEINPKFWGSLELCLASGMNFPLHICQMATGEELNYSENYRQNLLFQWIISTNGELYRLVEKPSDFFSVLSDFLKFGSKSDIWITDIKPTWMEFVYFLIFLKNRLFK
jgi:predicted ATP-grasp superfamily ATP-dependent carboligase